MECGTFKEVLPVKVSLDGYYYRQAGSLLMFYLCFNVFNYYKCVEFIYADMMDEIMEYMY